MSLFVRKSTDDTTYECPWLENAYAGPTPSAVWLMGSGPSLKAAPHGLIARSPAPIMAVNFAGRGPDGQKPYLWPDLWCSWDDTARFTRSIFLDSRIRKFVNVRRRKDLLPEGSEKVCDCPETYFFETESRGYADFLDPTSEKINDCRDSFVVALDICFRLGFRKVYCIGCDFIVRPSKAQIAAARERGVQYEKGGVYLPARKGPPDHSDRYMDFLKACAEKQMASGVTDVAKAMEELPREAQYSFTERKAAMAGATSDLNSYWRVIQHLRLSRRCFAINGLELVSCTPGSRLNAYFPYRRPQDVARELLDTVGDPEAETTEGRYRGQHKRPNEGFPLMSDMPPHNWEHTLARRNGEAYIDRKLPEEPKQVADVQQPPLAKIKALFDQMQNGDDVVVQEEA